MVLSLVTGLVAGYAVGAVNPFETDNEVSENNSGEVYPIISLDEPSAMPVWYDGKIEYDYCILPGEITDVYCVESSDELISDRTVFMTIDDKYKVLVGYTGKVFSCPHLFVDYEFIQSLLGKEVVLICKKHSQNIERTFVELVFIIERWNTYSNVDLRLVKYYDLFQLAWNDLDD